MLYIDNGKEEKSRKFAKINKDKLFDAVKRYKAPVLTHLYMMMVVLANIALNNGTNSLERLLDILSIVNTETSEGSPYMPEDRRYEEVLKKAIQRESDKVCNGKLYLVHPHN